ncbi:UNVERIFIED_ORG: hypothetical protein GGI66_006178 [Rhizobium esperanzae]
MADLDIGKVAKDMIAKAADIAKNGWKEIKEAVEVEFHGIAERIGLILKAYANKKFSKEQARSHMRVAKGGVITTLAMVTMMTEAVITKIVNSAFSIVRDAVNTVAKFTLL